jgi:hypothetical protein
MPEAPEMMTADDLLADMRDMLANDPDQNAMIYLGGPGHQLGMVPCIDMPPRDTLRALGMLVLDGKIDPPVWVTLVADSYTSTDMTESERGQLVGSLESLFKAGDPRVGEAMIALGMHSDGTSFVVEQPYVHQDGCFTWGEIKHSDGMEGPMVDAMRTILRASSAVQS